MRAPLTALLVLGACTSQEWRVGGTIAADGLIACDLGQTYYASDGGAWDRPGEQPGTVQRELNPLLGRTPGVATLGAVGAGTMAVTTLVGARAPKWVAIPYFVLVGSVELYLVAEHVPTAGMCGMRQDLTSTSARR